MLLAFAMAGIVSVVLVEWAGFLSVTSLDVSRRFPSVTSWRRAQAIGIVLLPGLVTFWSIFLGLTGVSVVLTARSTWFFVFGSSLFVLAACWTRLIVFVASKRHWEEAGKIITARKKK